jgi:hypothetical protein
VTSGKVRLKPFIERHPMSQGPTVLEQVAGHAMTRRPILEPDWSDT